MYPPSRHAPTFFVPITGQPIKLQRIELGRSTEDLQKREAFIQELVHRHPEIIPMLDIEPAFTPLIPICRELETPAGPIDNLWLTPAGGIVIGECKLVRNPQARREVLVQALDYARALSSWNYEELEDGVRKALKRPDMKLWQMVNENSGLAELDEEQFVDAVERKLRSSRFMILVIGDGIQEGVEALTEYLQFHPGLHVGLALVDLSIWHGVDGGWFIAPRIPLRTVLVERGIVIYGPSGQARIEPIPSIAPAKAPRAATASESEYFDQLELRRPGLSAQLRSFIAGLGETGISPEFRKSLVLRWQPSPDFAGSLGSIDSWGKVWAGDTQNTANKLNKPAVGDEYLQTIAALAGGTIRGRDKGSPQVIGPDDRLVDVEVLLTRGKEWKQAISRFVSAAKTVSDDPII